MPPSFERRGAKREPGRAKHQERGWFVQLPIIGGWNEPPLLTAAPYRACAGSARRLRPLMSGANVSPTGRNHKEKEASRLFLNGRSHPSFAFLRQGGELTPCVQYRLVGHA